MKRISAFIVITLLSISMFSAFAPRAKASTIDISAQYSSFVSAYNNYKQIFGQDVSIGQTVDRTLSGVISDPLPHHIWNSWAGQIYPGPGDGFSIRIETIQPDYVYKIIGLGYMAGSQPSASGWIKVNSPYNIEQINYVQNVTYGDGSYVHIYVDKSTGRVDFDAKWWNGPALIDAPAFEFAFTIAKPGGVLPAFSYDTTRTRAAYTYDTDTKRIVMFGGYTHWNGTLNADLWTFDPTTSQWTSITAGNQPTGRSDASLSYDSVAKKLITFGGGTISGETGETWTFQFTGSNTGTWTQVSGAGPSARAVAPMVFDPKNDLHVLFGGGQYVYSLGDTWVFNPLTGAWLSENPSPSPPQRVQAAMAYDSKTGKILLFGGVNHGAGSLLGDTWLYDGSTNIWQQVATVTAPSPRMSPSLACDGNGVFYLFGGWNMDAGGHSQYLSDTWKFDMATMQWTQLSPSTSPIGQSQGALVYIGGSRFVLLNEWRDSPLGDIWFFDAAQNVWSSSVPTIHTLGYWKFDEGSGTVAHDSSGNSFDGTIYGATWVDGVVNKALHFDGASNYVAIPDNPSLSGFSQLTLEAWIKPDSLSSSYLTGIVNKGNGGGYYGDEYGLQLNNDRVRFILSAGDPTGWIIVVDTDPIISVGQWYHVAAVWDSNNYYIYVNGQLAKSGPTLVTGAVTHHTSNSLNIGGIAAGGWLFNGAIDEPKIYNYARTAEEIQSDYASGTQGLKVTIQSNPPAELGTIPFAITFTAIPSGGKGSYSISWLVTSSMGGTWSSTQNPFTFNFKYSDTYIVKATTTCSGTSEVATAQTMVIATGTLYEAKFNLWSGIVQAGTNNPLVSLEYDNVQNQGYFTVSGSSVSLRTNVRVSFNGASLPDWLSALLGISAPWYSIEVSDTAGTVDAVPLVQLSAGTATPIDVTLPLGTPTTIIPVSYLYNFSASPTTKRALSADLVGSIFAVLGLDIGPKEPVIQRIFMAAVEHLDETMGERLVGLPFMSAADQLSLIQTVVNDILTPDYLLSLAAAVGGDIGRSLMTAALQTEIAAATVVIDFGLFLDAIYRGDLWDEYYVTQVTPMLYVCVDPPDIVNALLGIPDGTVGYNNGVWENERNIPGFYHTEIINNTYGFGIPITTTYYCANLTLSSANGNPISCNITVNWINETCVFQGVVTGTKEIHHLYLPSNFIPIIDDTAPTTCLIIGSPKYSGLTTTYVTRNTQFTLKADDGLGSGVAETAYRIFNSTYDNRWTHYVTQFTLASLSDGTYNLCYNSTDKAGNVEQSNTVTIAIDNTPPSTSLAIGDPKYPTVSSTLVTSSTSFALSATDGSGSGVASTFYKIWNGAYDSGWSFYSNPFCITTLANGNYTISYYSIDNVGNRETEHTVKITLFCWMYIFTDSYCRGTVLKVNPQYRLFQFIAPNKDFGVKYDPKMIVLKNAIIICYEDKKMSLVAATLDGRIDFCSAVAWDKQTGKCYLLIDKPNPPRCPQMR